MAAGQTNTIVCTLWGHEKYGPEHVDNLRAQCADYGHNLRTTDLRHPEKYKGWFAKLELYAPWNEHLRPCVSLDLDTYVVGDLTPILELPDELFVLKGHQPHHRGNSSVVRVPTDTSEMWDTWVRDSEKYDSESYFHWQFPRKYIQDYVDGIYSYTDHNLRAHGIPEDARLICFQGNRKPGTKKFTKGTWMQEHWNAHV